MRLWACQIVLQLKQIVYGQSGRPGSVPAVLISGRASEANLAEEESTFVQDVKVDILSQTGPNSAGSGG